MQNFKRSRVSSEDVVKYANVCIALPPLDKRAFRKAIRENFVLSLVKHYLLKQLSAGKKQVSPLHHSKPIRGKKTLQVLGKAMQLFTQDAQHHKLLTT